MIHFLDIGARKGRTARWLLNDEKLDIHIYMFEPNPKSFRGLVEKFDGNPRVSLYSAALTDTEGVTRLYWDEETGEGSSLYKDKKTSIGAPWIPVNTIDANEFIQNLPEGPVVFYSNCEGSEFEILDVILYNETWKKISLWSIAFHHGDRKIPSMKPTYFKLEARMAELGITNVPGHFRKKLVIELEEFISHVKALA